MSKNNRLRALILVAVSTPEQAKDKKQSLRTQERDLRAIAEQRDWDVIGVLKIPGFSRDYVSWEECERDMLANDPPITAMRDLRKMTDERAYDVFMVRDADRFGRTQSLIMQIAETICVRQRLKIYSQIDNTLVEGEAARFWAAMTGLRSAGEMDKKRIYHSNGMDNRAAQGFYEARTPFYHTTLHDELTGEEIGVVVNEDYRPIWDAAYRLIVEDKVGFYDVERLLEERFGLVNPKTGRRFDLYTFHRLMYASPGFWGHRVRNVRPTRGKQYSKFGAWTFDPNAPLPDGVKIWRDVLPPIYTGEQSMRLIEELRRRKMMRGGRKPMRVTMFAGLLVCDYCHYHLHFQRNPNTNWYAYVCKTNYLGYQGRPHCDSKSRSIKVEAIQAWFNDLIQQCAQDGNIQRILASDTQPDYDDQLKKLKTNIEAVEDEAQRLIDRLSLVPESMLAMHQKKMKTVDTRLQSLRQEYERLNQQAIRTDWRDQELGFRDILEIGLEKFWKLPEADIHQSLCRLLGEYRLVVREGEILGLKRLSH